MMVRKVVTVLLGLCLGGAGLAVWQLGRAEARIDPANPRLVELGRPLYVKHCAQCHGANLEGEADWQTRKPNGELPAPPHDASGHTWHHANEQLFALIKHGVARFAPPGYKTAMPGYVGVLSDSEIRAVLSYIQSTWPQEIRDRRAAMEQN
ncbi:Cytochrome [Candidatus Terasakiella magnetica]|nr:Cytochrome [Candidatus Terasakiella magnetica]